MAIGPIMLDLEGLQLTQEEQELLKHPQTGGVILFSRNYQNPEQLENLVKQIRLNSHRRLLIAVDHEGGRVQRFREGFTHLPALNQIGKLYDQNPKLAQHFAAQHAWLMASELLAFNIDFSFAPILDLNKNTSEVIGDRAFHTDPYIVAKLTTIYIDSMQHAGMSAVGKHFPGHGTVAADSHIDIPVDERDYQTIATDDLLPFKHLTAKLPGIMPAHVIYPKVDAMPAGFSHYWLQTILRNQLKFNGAIFSDDLCMQGATFVGDIPQRIQAALAAGCDMLLVCNNRTAAIQALEYLEQRMFRLNLQSSVRLQKMCGQHKISRAALVKQIAWRNARELMSNFAN